MAEKGSPERWTGDEPKLRTADVLVWIYRNRPEGFTVRDVMQQFSIARGEAHRRIGYMVHAWGAAKEVSRLKAHRRGRREVVYALTAWGNKYAARRTKRGGSKAAANED